MPTRNLPADAPTTGIRVLVADDDGRVRLLFAVLLRAAAGVASVIEAKDRGGAAELGRASQRRHREPSAESRAGRRNRRLSSSENGLPADIK